MKFEVNGKVIPTNKKYKTTINGKTVYLTEVSCSGKTVWKYNKVLTWQVVGIIQYRINLSTGAIAVISGSIGPGQKQGSCTSGGDQGGWHIQTCQVLALQASDDLQ